MHKILTVMGTRPEIIKMVPVVKALRKHLDLETTVLCTGQHREMSNQYFDEFGIYPDINLDIMKENQSLGYIVAKTAEKIEPVLNHLQPQVVLVQGDTSTAAIGAIISYYNKIAVGHIEAGLRTHNKYFPHPEEINRQIISRFATFNFVPTINAKTNLENESVDSKTIHYVGNTVVDSLLDLINYNERAFKNLDKDHTDRVLVTAHRRENFGKPMENICNAIKAISNTHENVKFIFPVHPNPNVQKTVYSILADIPQVMLCEPLNYLELVKTIYSSKIILTDSGGIQEEAPTFQKPVLVMRNETERPEGVDAGIAKLVGTDQEIIISSANELLTDSDKYDAMTNVKNPYGDGKSAVRIVNIIRNFLDLDIFEEIEDLEDYYLDQVKP